MEVMCGNTPTETVGLDRTWQEIYDAFPNVAISIAIESAIYAVLQIQQVNGEYVVTYMDQYGQLQLFQAGTASGYPYVNPCTQ